MCPQVIPACEPCLPKSRAVGNTGCLGGDEEECLSVFALWKCVIQKHGRVTIRFGYRKSSQLHSSVPRDVAALCDSEGSVGDSVICFPISLFLYVSAPPSGLHATCPVIR
ncbi:hypothetical protein EYF80_031904 [Liparis tanakae]|uniref:Uncharacterized protein n=1 Tax=Liparis tanakae TaxID=230148 RepID=A0A4Z2GXS0_9TELE|nr:hypothetical protein EYF80_031904 [Liparis tanakae]